MRSRPKALLNSSALRWWKVPGPGVPKASWPGLSLASFTRSATERTGRIGIDHQHIGHARHQGDRNEIDGRIVGQALAHRDVERHRGRGRHHEGVAVGGRARDRGRGDHRARARLVLDHERPPEALLQLLREQAREQIGRPARRIGHHEADLPVRIVLRRRAPRPPSRAARSRSERIAERPVIGLTSAGRGRVDFPVWQTRIADTYSRFGPNAPRPQPSWAPDCSVIPCIWVPRSGR